MSRQNNEHIIKFHGAFETNEIIYTEIDYCAEGDLASYEQRQENGRLTKAKILDIFLSCLYALHDIHQYEIIHRDIKKENILIDKDLHVKIADFGVSGAIGDK